MPPEGYTHTHTHTQDAIDDKAHGTRQIWLDLQTSLVSSSVDVLAVLRILTHKETDNRRTKNRRAKCDYGLYSKATMENLKTCYKYRKPTLQQTHYFIHTLFLNTKNTITSSCKRKWKGKLRKCLHVCTNKDGIVWYALFIRWGKREYGYGTYSMFMDSETKEQQLVLNNSVGINEGVRNIGILCSLHVNL
jgi:hypothetical protein